MWSNAPIYQMVNVLSSPAKVIDNSSTATLVNHVLATKVFDQSFQWMMGMYGQQLVQPISSDGKMLVDESRGWIMMVLHTVMVMGKELQSPLDYLNLGSSLLQ